MTPSPLAIDRATLKTWPPRKMEELNGWVLCADTGVSGRVNTCWPLDWRGGDVGAGIEAVEAWLRARGLAPSFKVTDGAVAPEDLVATLEARGYAQSKATRIMLVSLSSEVSPYSDVALSAAMPPAFVQALRDSSPDEADFAERHGIASRTPAPCAFAVRDGSAAVGMSAIADKLAAIYLMRTVPKARRQGHARHILRALLGWAAREGADYAFLQVDDDNLPAVALYEHEGFETLSLYHYWKKA